MKAPRGLVFELVRGPIDLSRALASVPRDGRLGAVVTFEGVVRDQFEGREVLHLAYETYEEMAAGEMERLYEEVRDVTGVHDIVVVHRIGEVPVGETSIVVVAASVHRARAFDACRLLMDRIKARLPVWKKERFEGGEVWVENEECAG